MADVHELPLQTRIAPVATVDQEKRTVEMVWSTGAGVLRYDWRRDKNYIEELSMDPAHVRMDRLNSGAPLLNTHGRYDLSDVIGVVEKAWVKDGEGRAVVRFSEREDVAGIWQDVAAGIIRNVSVGYAVHRYEQTQNDSGPDVWRAVDWSPMEISLVPVPADAGAGVRSNDTARQFRCEFIRGTSMDPNTNEAPADAPADTPSETTAAREAPKDSMTDVLAAERLRYEEIHEAVRAAGLPDTVAAEFIRRGTPADTVRRECLRKLAEQSDASVVLRGPTVQAGNQDATITRREAMAEAIHHRVAPGGQLPERAREYRYMSLLRLAEECLIASGVSVRGLAPMEIAARAMHTTSDFPNILANVMNKRLRQAYDQSQPTYRQWARRASNAPDFKAIAVNQLSGAPDLLQLDEHGEFRSGALSDGKETYQVVTYGRVLSVSRQAIVNDDLRAFDRLPVAFGMAANRLENRLVYAQLTANANMSDGVALFHANHGNLAGTNGAITGANLGTARAAMRLQKGLQKEILNIVPRYLIVPAAIEQVAYQWTSANYVPAKTTDTNEFRAGGRTALEPIVEPELDGNSATAWYLAAEPGLIDTVEFCYLDGSEGVYLEAGADFDVDGMKLKARLDFATKVIDWRGLYKNNGA